MVIPSVYLCVNGGNRDCKTSSAWVRQRICSSRANDPAGKQQKDCETRFGAAVTMIRFHHECELTEN